MGRARNASQHTALLQRSQAKIALVVPHNTNAASTIGDMALDYTVRAMQVQERRNMSRLGIRDADKIEHQVLKNVIYEKIDDPHPPVRPISSRQKGRKSIQSLTVVERRRYQRK
jgi:hypothetical protein